jgi:hypothetical protein
MNFNDIIADIRRRTKAGELPREVRIAEIDKVTEEYYLKTGKMPDNNQLERLADLILHEELTDTNPHKIATTEYPIMSESQYERRVSGKNSRKVDNEGKRIALKHEVSFGSTHGYGTDMRKYDKPVRRRWSVDEALEVDKRPSLDENKRESYDNFVKGGKAQ